MENAQIARLFEDVAILLEITAANPFRIQAYRNAAQSIADQPRSVADLAAAGEDLTKLDFVGKDLAASITDLVTTGKLRVLEELDQQVPRTLLEVLRIPGIGAKTAAKLWRELDVTDLASLEAALRSGKVAKLDGFGAKTVGNLERRIERYRQRDSSAPEASG
jgi:DNA polymerase (family 10)